MMPHAADTRTLSLTWQWGAALALSLLLTACASPPPSDQLLLARSAYHDIENNPGVARSAAQQLAEAREALDKAERSHQAGDDPSLVNHYAYLAEKHAETAKEQARQATLRDQLIHADETRKDMMIRAQTSQAQQATAEAEQLRDELEALQAEQTERGMVVTLSDVLFDFDQADLKAAGTHTVDKLAQFLMDHPERRVLIEGHTDNIGDPQYNQGLSERRAQAVKRGLVDAGIDPSRIATRGYGQDYPVASNDSRSGRQQNRRVEVVISDENGEIRSR